MNSFIYADNAATTKLDLDAYEAMKPYLIDEYGNASQPYSFSRTSKKALKEARKMIAECINCKPNEIYFTSGGTESNNWAIKESFISNMNKSIISSEIEHHAILNCLKTIVKLGCDVKYIKPNKNGLIEPSYLSRLISKNDSLVSVMFVNNEIGTIQPIKELAKIAHLNGAIFHTDAVQAVGHIKIDVETLGVDMLSASAHKFNGPKGIGFLYIREGTNILPYMDGGAQESNMRAGTENIPAIVGMAYALKNNCDHISENQSKILQLENKLIELLDEANIDYIRNGKNTIPGNISLSFKNKNGESILHRLDLKRILVSTGSACNGKNTEISHVLRAIQLDKIYAKGTIRVSLGKDNSIEDVKKIAEAIIEIVE